MAFRPLAAVSLFLLAGAAAPAPTDFASDARSIEGVVNANYGYLERFPDGKMPMTAKLRAEAAAVTSEPALIRYAERALTLLADHHAITGSSLSDSWAVFPSYGDLWIEREGDRFVITAVRDGSPADKAGVTQGDLLLAVAGRPTATAVSDFWADVGASGGGERDDYAARVLAAGRRDRPRQLDVARTGGQKRSLTLANLYTQWRPDGPAVESSTAGGEVRIRFRDSLGDDETIAEFDQAMAKVRPGQRVVIDLTDTASGGNTVVARAILSWFVRKPSSYQVHNLPAEQRETGIARQWVEQVLPRAGKFHPGPVVVRVGRWTGSMGEGIAIGFAALGKRVEGDRMAGLLGAVYDYPLEKSGKVIKFPTERLSAVNGTPREKFIPAPDSAR